MIPKLFFFFKKKNDTRDAVCVMVGWFLRLKNARSPLCLPNQNKKNSSPCVSVCLLLHWRQVEGWYKYMYTINRKWLEANHTLWIIDNSRLLINASGFYLPSKSCCYLKYLYFSNSTFTRINYFIFVVHRQLSHY